MFIQMGQIDCQNWIFIFVRNLKDHMWQLKLLIKYTVFNVYPGINFI